MSRLLRRLVRRASRSVGVEVPMLSGHEEIPLIVGRLADLKSQIDRSLFDLRTTGRDIVQRLGSLQEEVARARKLRVLDETMGGLVHNFNNSLAAILGYTEVLLREAPDATTRRRLGLIQQIVLEAAAMVRRLGESVGQTPQVAQGPVALRALVTDALERTAPRWRDEAERQGAAVAVSVAVDGVSPIDGNPVELRDALVRLILDAVAAMPRGGTLAIRARDEMSGWASIEVSDSGSGAREMSVVTALVERQGGTVELAQDAGSGTTVRLRFLASRGAILPAVEEPRRPPATETRSILLVEDDARVLRALTDLLEAHGHTVIGVGSGAEALARFDPATVDVVITDLGMPGMTGWEVASAVKAREPRMPVYLLTGWGDAIGKDERSRYVDRIIAKPVSADVVLASIGRVARSDVRSERVAEA